MKNSVKPGRYRAEDDAASSEDRTAAAVQLANVCQHCDDADQWQRPLSNVCTVCVYRVSVCVCVCVCVSARVCVCVYQ